MTVKEIVEKYLNDNKFEGLFCSECACAVGDLFPCGENNVGNCEPGYKLPCTGEDRCPNGGGCAFHIGEKSNEEK